jgi:uncharacterized membrane protein YphA (DoxX/SURF4 family)
VPNRISISLATVIMLVLLRLNVGWHFFGEGVKHYADPTWTSEPTLRSATGPLASWYHAYLPDFHGFEDLLHANTSQSEAHAVRAWIDAIGNDWDIDRQTFVNDHGLDKEQQSQAKAALVAYQKQLRSWANRNKDALETHVHAWRRKETALETPAATEVPFERRRVASTQSILRGEAGSWRADLTKLEGQYDNALAALLTADQQNQRSIARPRSSIDLVDGVMTYMILAVGALLLLGLFTRVACLTGAVFLLSVVMMQPFWASDALPTYNQYIEMVALLALATTSVGRWAGLDFFVHRLVAGSNRPTKGPTDAFES